MKRFRETLTAALLLALLVYGSGSAWQQPQTLWSRFRDGYYELRPDSPTPVERMNALIGGAERAVSDSLDTHRYITLYGGIQRLIGNRVVYDADTGNNVARLSNGKLQFVSLNREPSDVTLSAERMNELAAYDRALGIDTLFLMLPQKIGKYEDVRPAGVYEFGNEEGDAFLALLEADTAALDLREAFRDAPGGHDSYFFTTDHHWKPEGAFLGFQTLAETLRADYGFTIDEALTDRGNYREVVYEDIFLGSQGKRVGPWYAGVDDLTLLLPAEETAGYRFEIPHKSVVRSGSFEDAFLFYEMVARVDHYNLNPYVVYTGGDYPLSIAANENAPNDKRVLLIRQSFSCALAPYLARACAELDIIDPRYYEDSIREYIAQTRPELVLVAYCTGDTRNEALFEPLTR